MYTHANAYFVADLMLLQTSTEIDDQAYTQNHSLTSTPFSVKNNSCDRLPLSTLDEIENQINVVVPYLLLLGILGNGFSILTFSQRKLRELSCGCYLLILAISDTIALLIISRPYFFKRLNIVHHLNSSIVCGLQLFLTKIFDELTPWLLVFVACNRLVLSRYPHNRHYFQTSRAALWSTFVLTIVLILINAHLLFGIRVGHLPEDSCTPVCGPVQEFKYYVFFYTKISPIIDLFLGLIVPFCLLFVANILILINVRRVKRRVLRIRRRKRASRNARLSIVLLADLITFLIVSIPVLLVECIYRFTQTTSRNSKIDQYLWIAWLIANKIFYLNYSLSFYFYVLTSSYFRHHFLLAIHCRKLHNVFYQPVKRESHESRLSRLSRQSCQMTDFVSRNSGPFSIRTSKLQGKPYESQSVCRSSYQQQDIALDFALTSDQCIL